MTTTATPALERVERWLAERCGLEVLPGERERLAAAVAACAAAARLDPEPWAARLSSLASDDPFARRLVDAWAIPETSFFRTQGHFEALAGKILPERRTARNGRPLRIWSAACSTGPEAYTLAMVAAEVLGAAPGAVEVLATDLRDSALAEARLGVYTERVVQKTPAAYRERYLTQTPGGWRVDEGLRRRVRFEVHNLTRDPFPADNDVIFCRNVLIYFSPSSRRKVLEGFHRALAPGGYIFVGHSETLRDAADLFEPVWFGTTFTFRRLGSRGATAVRPARPAPARTPVPVPPPRPAPAAPPAAAPRKHGSSIRRRRGAPVPPRVIALASAFDAETGAEARVKEILLQALRDGPAPRIVHLERVGYLDRDATVWLRRALRVFEADRVPVALAVEPEPVRAWLEREWGGGARIFSTVAAAQAALQPPAPRPASE